MQLFNWARRPRNGTASGTGRPRGPRRRKVEWGTPGREGGGAGRTAEGSRSTGVRVPWSAPLVGNGPAARATWTFRDYFWVGAGSTRVQPSERSSMVAPAVRGVFEGLILGQNGGPGSRPSAERPKAFQRGWISLRSSAWSSAESRRGLDSRKVGFDGPPLGSSNSGITSAATSWWRSVDRPIRADAGTAGWDWTHHSPRRTPSRNRPRPRHGASNASGKSKHSKIGRAVQGRGDRRAARRRPCIHGDLTEL